MMDKCKQSCWEGADREETKGAQTCTNGPHAFMQACDWTHANTKGTLSSRAPPRTAQIGLNEGGTQAVS